MNYFSFQFISAGDSFHSINSELRELPAVELSTLPLILKVTLDAMDALVLFILCFIFLFGMLLLVIFWPRRSVMYADQIISK